MKLFHIQKARHFTKNKTICVTFFIYKKPDTLCYAIFQEFFEIGIYIQKARHFSLRDVFIYKNPDTSQKARQFALRFFIYIKPDTLRYAIFYGIFEIGRGGGHFYM